MKKQSVGQEYRYHTKMAINVSPFIDAETIAQLEPSLNRHYIGSSKGMKKQPSLSSSPNSKDHRHQVRNPPPLPEVPSSSDVYARKIELFKKKLKNLKGISTTSSTVPPSNIPSIAVLYKKNNENDRQQFTQYRHHPHTAHTPENVIYNQEYIQKNNSRITMDDSSNTASTPSSTRTISSTNLNDLNQSDNNSNTNNIRNDTLNDRYPIKFNPNSFETSSPTIPTFPLSATSAESNMHLPNISKTEIPLKKRSLMKQNKCSICNIYLDTFYNLQDGERIIELKCDHMAHEECLIMELDLNISMANIILPDRSKVLDYLPTCTLCNGTSRAIPKNNNILTDLYNRILTCHIENSHSNSFTNNNTSNGSMNSPLTPTFSESSRFLDTENSSNSEFITNHANTADILKNSQKNSPSTTASTTPSASTIKIPNVNTELKKFADRSKRASYKTHSKKASRGSVASATSAIISSVDDTHDLGLDNEYSWCSGFTEDLVQQKFLEDLTNLSLQGIAKDSIDHDIILNADFIKSLGSLRIVDKIKMVTGINGKESKPVEHYCYLFQHMLLVLNSTDFSFDMVSINMSTFIDSAEPGSLIMKNSKNSKDYHKFIFNCKALENNWNTALNNLRLRFDTSLFTSTIKIDEFDHLIDNNKSLNNLADVETLGTLQSYIGEDGYRRLPTGVCPRFYESTINSLVFKSKPTNAIIVLNQDKCIPNSVISIKNTIRSLSMIGIDILLIFCSTSTLSIDCDIVDSYELHKKDLKKSGDSFLHKIDDFQKKLAKGISTHRRTTTVYNRIGNYIDSIDNQDSGDVLSVVISNTTLKYVKDIPTTNNIMIEIGLDANQKSNRLDVADLADWSDIMEVICVCCGLEFDESDFYLSSEDEDDDDDDDDEDEDEDEDEDDFDDRFQNRIHRNGNSIDNVCTGMNRALEL